jgi:hypothetical protein
MCQLPLFDDASPCASIAVVDLAGIVATGRRDDEVQAEIAAYTREHRNASRLVAYLRRVAREGSDNAPALSPELAALVADALDGSLKAKCRPFTAYEPEHLRRLVDATRELLAERHPGALERARRLGHAPQTKAEVTEAARTIVAFDFGLTRAQLDQRLYPRSGRGKRG